MVVDACLPVASGGHRYSLVNCGTLLLMILQVTETAHVINNHSCMYTFSKYIRHLLLHSTSRNNHCFRHQEYVVSECLVWCVSCCKGAEYLFRVCTIINTINIDSAQMGPPQLNTAIKLPHNHTVTLTT